MNCPHTFLTSTQGLLYFLNLNWSQVLAIGYKCAHIIATADVDMLQDLHSEVSELLVLLLQILLDHLEDVAQVDLISCSL